MLLLHDSINGEVDFFDARLDGNLVLNDGTHRLSKFVKRFDLMLNFAFTYS